ncbi:MAG TPA: tetratricopeptide repeat protein [Usitatibacter sp.]|nr:tetratricopeptide repeat protein [Usitatibacter sp.]
MAQNPIQEAAQLHHQAIRFHTEGDNDRAVELMREAIAKVPLDASLHNTTGSIELARGDLAAAERALRAALDLDAAYAEARFNLAVLLLRKSQPDAALKELERILAQRPDFGPARIERAILMLDRGGAEESLRELRAASAAQPGDDHLANALAAACEKVAVQRYAAGDAPGAAEALREQLRLQPASRNAAFNLAVTLHAQGQTAEAKSLLAGAVARGHDDPALLCTLAGFRAEECDWTSMGPLVERLRQRAVQPGPQPAYPQVPLYLTGVTAREQRAIAENWARVAFPAATPARPAARTRTGKLRVGFLSGELQDHPTAYLMAGMLEHHDRDRFEFAAYSFGADDGSPWRARMRAAFDRFEDVSALDNAAIAERIRRDGVDVLLDLTGYVRGSRMEVLASRPARVQGHYLGYPGTSGAPFVDFLVADAWTVPPELEGAYSERVLRMPATYQPNDPSRAVPQPSPLAGSGVEGFDVVFCCFNQPIKITEPVFERWCRLLQAVPRSCLWLAEFNRVAEQNLRNAAAIRGIDASRLVFAPRLESRAHLARLAHAHIALDTFPCTSHTTASDMLWAGVPLLTTYGDTFASRVAASVLAAAGCAEWAFADAEAAFAATVALAGDKAALAAAKAKAAAARGSHLFDARGYARDFEALIEKAATL